MIKRIFSFVVIAAIISSCGNSGSKEASSKAAESTGPVKVEFASLAANPAEYVGKNVIVEGKVVHVCTESGKKLFIVGENPDITLYIAAGENMPKFPMELLGTTVSVEGSIKMKGSTTAMEASEKPAAMLAEGGAKPMKMGGDTCVTEKALAKQSTLADVIMDYKSHTVK
jgi:RecJ-like exonuclease